MFLAVILSVLTYTISEPNWIGSYQQIAALFGWAFVVDVSVQDVTAAFGNTTTATPPSLSTAPEGGGAHGG